MTLKDYILRWQEVYDKNQSRPTTYAAHGYLFKNHILPGLGEIQLSELTTEQVGDFLEERRRYGGHRLESPEYPGLGKHTMRHIHRLLQQCLDQAMRDGLIADNPARAFRYPKPKKVSANVLTPAEVEDYLDAAARLGHLPMFLLALTVGLRQGELIALKWSDLDTKERTLTITEKRSVERRELVEYEGGTRIVSLTKEVVELLCKEHARHPSSPLMFMLSVVVILLVAGLIPKFSAVLTTIPQCVLGGATITVFASIAMTGIKLVMTEDMNYRNTSIVGLSVALGMGVTQAANSLAAFPDWATTIFGKSPVVVATCVAILLNVILPRDNTAAKKN